MKARFPTAFAFKKIFDACPRLRLSISSNSKLLFCALSSLNSLTQPEHSKTAGFLAMLVILLGPNCSGKDTIASHLANTHSFTRVYLASQLSESSDPSSLDKDRSEAGSSSKAAAEASSLTFDTPTAFLDYATLHWRQHFVTTIRLSKKHLEAFRKRPWVLLVNVEAPLTWRFARCCARCASSPS